MRLNIILTATILTTIIHPAFAQNWTSNQGSAAHTGFIDMVTTPKNYHQIWERKLGYKGMNVSNLNNMIITKNLAYFDVNETGADKSVDHRLIALSTNNGKTRWQKHLGKSDCVGLNYVDGKLLLTSNKDNNTWIRGYHPTTGKFVASLYLDGVARSTEGDDLNLYVMFKGELPIIASIDAGSGNTVWSIKETMRGVRGFAVSSRYLMTQVYDGTMFHELDTGNTAFGVSISNAWTMSNLERYPVIDDNTHSAYSVYMKQPGSPRPDNAALFAHDLSQRGVVRWEVPLQNVNTNPVAAGNEIYSTQYDNTKLNAVNAVTGKILWTWSPQDDLIHPEYPQLATHDVIFVVGNKKTYAVSRTTHQTVWETDKVGKLAIGDGKLFIHSMQDGSFDHVTAYALS